MAAFSFFILLGLGVPIFIVLAASALFFIAGSGEWGLLDSYLNQLYNGLGNFGLLAIPLFIITGELMNECGITARLVNLSRVLVGSMRSGLGYVNILANAMMAAIIGSAIAQTAVMSRVMVPEMERNGYPRADAAAMTCAGGLLGPIIPPSMPFIIYAVLAQVPVANMLLAGIIPGLMLGVSFLAVTAIIGFNKSYPRSERASRSEAFKIILSSLPALLVPLAIVTTIIGGFGSPTEAAAAGAAAAALVGGLYYKEFKLKRLPNVLERAGLNAAMVLVIIAASSVFGWVIIFEQIPDAIASLITGLTSHPLGFLLLVVLILMVIGMLIDGIAALIITIPILLPVAQDVYGLDIVQFGVVTVLTLVIGLLTPPVGAALYVSSGISGVAPLVLFKAVLPYIIASFVILIILCVFPILSTALI